MPHSSSVNSTLHCCLQITIGLQLYQNNIGSAKRKLKFDLQSTNNRGDSNGEEAEKMFNYLEGVVRGVETRCWAISNLINENIDLWSNLGKDMGLK